MTEPLRFLVVNEVPLWDARIRNILVELRGWIQDRDAAPIMKRDAISNLHGQLDMLLYQLDNGKWSEGILADPQPELEAKPEWPVLESAEKPVTALTPEEFHERWDELTHTDKLSWIMEGAR